MDLLLFFYIQCPKCKIMCLVPTDKQHISNHDNKRLFVTNTKAVTGDWINEKIVDLKRFDTVFFHTFNVVFMASISAGMRQTHLNKFSSGLNVSLMSWATYKSHEVDIGQHIEELSIDSCKKFALEEKRVKIENL